jgi:hypothetical protein
MIRQSGHPVSESAIAMTASPKRARERLASLAEVSPNAENV